MKIKLTSQNRFTNLVDKLKLYLTLKNSSHAAIPLNLASICLGIIFIIIGGYNIVWDIFGVILLIAIFNDLLLIHLIGVNLNKNNQIGGRFNYICYIFLIFTVIAFLGILAGNFAISALYTSGVLMFTILVYIWYFSFFGFAFIISLFCFRNLNNKDLWVPGETSEEREKSEINGKIKILKTILKIICFFTFLGGIYLAMGVLLGLYIDIVVIGTALAGMFGIFFSILILTNTILWLKLTDKDKKPTRYKRITIIGVFCSAILLVPLLATPSAYYVAERNFSEAFGEDWRDDIPSDVEKEYFLASPFSTPQYILGIPPKDCEIERDVKFYDKDGLTLYFDAFMPHEDPEDLPGKGTMLIRLHGGGWVMNDKGISNMNQMNKYFAAQGYIVFDVQYAQYDMGFDMPLTPEHLVGDYSIDEIVESLGYFTDYIADHDDDYDVDLDSVIVSGGSAGGHLTCALGLGIASEEYEDIFGDDLKIKGIVPYYPANGMMSNFGIEIDDDDLANPENLIDKDSPPCLIFQGTHDILSSWFHIAETIKNKYTEEDNDDCAIIWLPMGGHGCDYYFSGYYNQLFTYYMERFMFLCINDEI